MKKKAIVIIVVCLLAISAAVFGAYYIWNKPEGGVTVKLGGKEVVKRVKVEDLTLFPGESKTVSFTAECSVAGEYELSFAFEEREDKGLKPFVGVTVSVGGKLLGSAALKALLAGETIRYDLPFKQGEEVEIVLVYSMPDSVADEAQGTSATFDLEFRAKKK